MVPNHICEYYKVTNESMQNIYRSYGKVIDSITDLNSAVINHPTMSCGRKNKIDNNIAEAIKLLQDVFGVYSRQK
ncbi:MAG: hypothetical protein AABY32_01265 [Nanoarchaeota archaeon]